MFGRSKHKAEDLIEKKLDDPIERDHVPFGPSISYSFLLGTWSRATFRTQLVRYA